MEAQRALESLAWRSDTGDRGHDAAYAFDARRVDQGYVASSRSPFLSTLSPGRSQWYAAWAVGLLSVALFLALAPSAKVPWPQVPAFLPIYQSALIVVDMITMTLLLGQYTILRFRGLLVLACAYLFSALMAVAHALSFPGLFAPGGLMGGGQTTAWLYFLWHAGFPLLVMGYTLLTGRGHHARPVSSARAMVELAVGIGLTLAVAVACVAVARWTSLQLPLMAGHMDAQAKAAVATLTWLVCLAAFALLAWRRPHSVIDLWLMVVLCVWAADSALASVFNHARYDLGWYIGRVYGLVASSFILAVLLLENSMLYARLVEANEAQRRRAEDLQRLSTKLEAANRDLDAFAGGLAHDLQQPIVTIGAFAQVIQRQSGHLIGEKDASHLERIIGAASTAHRMIRSLLEFARLGQKEIDAEAVDLNLLLQEARNTLATDTGAPVAWVIGPLPTVRGDPSLLLLALVNLLSNAVKYSRGREQPQIRVEGEADPAGGSRVRISDNGIGFDMAQAGRLFRPFERLHTVAAFEGTGMGLANVRRIMERHGGNVQVEAAPGEGATFTLVFPPAESLP
ncbi:MASE4 domain-containing protein [Ramlibacter sp. WS9]|uniref:sensor histidine kinase n=1 Tax=Ramlibacter sp. WS9 TaxID=1882741 RepID=UPI001305414E|nr:MASE4 domain-containing protein [Ramlibacter sp. WS9]